MSSESGSSSGAQLAKNFSRISLLGLAFITLNSWTAFSSALPLSLTSGGPTSIVWGLLTAGVCTLCIAASLAEFLSAYPTAAGRYRWVAGKSSCRWSTISLGWEDIDRYLRHFVTAVSWDDYERVLSWFTAWANVAAWVSIAYISFTTVLFMFPPARPVTGSTMNYAIAATGVFALLSAIYWFVRGRKHFMQVLVTAEMAIPEARPSSCPIKSDV
ncbi:hypothetical protein KXV95_003842 [Aspergillus fumigatus]|nr:hypothetical protein KXX18_006014 [Aspergillus fumigatus]KAH2219149.1 hypothetical protein KXV37_003439 [Aspergillus fumigatus]KAH2934874.1 hypothetical protein KXW45_004401 [Aspergillus fumigatus]KAH3037744.1 hypothetical protein KXV27_007192 [Aspergillus fumigatus]KAH3579064.1 hypothetical protein KXV95_003842 [Aspergillus fumigatus]